MTPNITKQTVNKRFEELKIQDKKIEEFLNVVNTKIQDIPTTLSEAVKIAEHTDGLDLNKHENKQTLINYLLVNGYIVPESNPEIQQDGSHEKDPRIREVYFDEFKRDHGLIEFQYDKDTIQNQSIPQRVWIEEYTHYLVREVNKVKCIIKSDKKDTSTDKSNRFVYVYDEDERVWKPDEGRVKKMLQQELPEYATRNAKQELIEKIKHKDPVYDEEVGTEPHEIAVANGILNLKTRELRDIQKDDYVVQKLPVKYDPDAECPKFREYLQQSVKNDVNRDKLQEYAGSTLRTDWTERIQKALILLGPTDSGKSVFIKVIQDLIGKRNYSAEGLRALADEDHVNGQLMDKLVNTNAELSTKLMDRRDKIKQIVAGDELTVNQKFENRFKFKPKCKHIYGANETPDLNDHGNDKGAFFNRFLVAEFPSTIPKEEQNDFLVDEINEELPGVLNWMIEGMKRLEKQGFQFTSERTPVEVRKKWREYGNSVDKFIAEFIETRNEVRNRLLDQGYSEQEIMDKMSDMTFYVTLDYAQQVYDQFCMVTGREQYRKEKLSEELDNIKQSLKKKMNGGSKRGVKFEKIRMVKNPTDKIQEIAEKENAKGVNE